LTLVSVVLLTLGYMAPLVALSIFGIVAEVTGGAAPMAYLVCGVAMLFTAMSYARLARRFPMAGSAYTFTRRTIDSRLGFVVGWMVLMAYVLLPLITALLGATFLQAWFPALPLWFCLLVFIVPVTALNIFGLSVMTTVIYAIFAYAGLVILLWVVFAAKFVSAESGFTALFSLQPFWNDNTTLSGVLTGAALAALSFLGFDAATTMTEETRDAARTIPRAVILSCLIGTALYVISTYFGTLVHPGAVFKDVNSGAAEVAETMGGAFMSSVLLSGLVIVLFLAMTMMITTASRLLYAMGRDGVLPKRVLCHIHPRFHTPWVAVLLLGCVSVAVFFMDIFSLASLINVGSFVAFTCVNLAVIALAFRERESRRSGWVVTMIVFPAVGAAVGVWLLTKLDAFSIMLAGIWLAVGLCWLIVLTRGFRQAPPEMDFSEEEAILAEEDQPAVVGAALAMEVEG
jgi:amino acid transporter